MKTPSRSTTVQLFADIAKLKSTSEIAKFFEDLTTPRELESLADRWLAAKLVAQGVSYRNVYARTGVSTATVTRVSRALNSGAGGYKLMMKRLGIEVES